nr:hypothetical protein CFP56_38626 [Quercus suber]
MTSLPPCPTLISPPPYPHLPPLQPAQLRHPYTPSLPPQPLPTFQPYNPYHPPLPFFTPPQFFWPTFGQGPPSPSLIPVPIASSHSNLQPKLTSTPTQPPNVSHPSTLQPIVTPTQPPKPQQPKPKPQSGGLEWISAVFHIDSKVFSLAFDGGRIDSYAIHERRGKFHGSIRVGRLGLDWIIACLADLDQWNFRKQPFFKRLCENSKLLEFASRFNKGGLFVEISEYHNGARRGCLRVPEGTKIGGWTLFGRRLRDYFLGKSNAGPMEKVVARGGEFEKAGDIQNPQVWKKLNGHENKGSNLRFVKYLPSITGQRNQFESLGGFDDVSKKLRSASVSTAGDGSDDLQISEWVTGEGLGTHEDEEGEIPSSGEGLGGSPIADMNSDEGPDMKPGD